MTQTIPLSAAERAGTNYTEDDDCWVSNYSTGSHGYAQVGWFNRVDGRGMTTAHRASWKYHYGDDPGDMTVDHLCRNRRCVRPDHLRLLGNRDNARMNSAAGHYPLEWSCHRNHPAERRSTVTGVCLDCHRIASKRYESRKADRLK